MKVTIKDIAKEAGFSTATVSKVLNKKDGNITEATRQKVLKAVEELNYIPNAAARSLVTRKTKTIGLIIPDITNPFFPELARGAEDQANALGYNIIFCNTDDHFDKEKKYINMLAEKLVDGIIFTQSAQLGDEFKEIQRLGIPLVLIDRDISIEGVKGRVLVDNYHGAYKGVKHMILKGYKKIAFITGPLTTKTAKDRLKGYKQALKDYKIPYDETLVLEGQYKSHWGEEAILKLLNQKKLFDSIFCGNDLIAIGAIKQLKENNLEVPEDIGILGYDDIYFSKFMSPALTTIMQPKYLMGQKAVEILVSCIEGKKMEEKNITLKTKLIQRDSL